MKNDLWETLFILYLLYQYYKITQQGKFIYLLWVLLKINKNEKVGPALPI